MNVSLRSEAASPYLVVVDDDESARLVMERILRLQGYRVVTFDGAHPALEWLERSAGETLGVVTDIVMPRMLGTEFAAVVRRRWPELPLLFVSGHAEPESLTEFAPLGPEHGVSFLKKPYPLTDLFGALRDLGMTPSAA